MKFRELLMLVAMITSSFDIFLVVNIGPNFRFTQLIIILIIFYILLFERNIKFRYPPFFILLVIFFILNLFFVLNSGYIAKGLGYAAWLLFNLLTVFVINFIFYNTSNVKLLIKYYILTFVFVSIFCYLQLVAGFLGYGENFLVSAWWIKDKVPRLNGFSYEPSFLVAYIITAWSFLALLNFKKFYLFTKSNQFVLTLSLAGTIILSGSRLGILVLLFFYLILIVISVVRAIVKLKVPRKFDIITPFTVTTGLLLILSAIIVRVIDYKILLNGLGIGTNNSSHSVSTRTNGMEAVIDLFMQNPFSGVSLGGISFHLAKAQGLSVDSFESAKIEGNGVIFEIFAATGILGGLLFVSYLILLAFNTYSTSRRVTHDKSVLLIATFVSLFFLWMILQPNQNVLRPYLWIHFGVLSGLLSCYRRKVCRM